jgi:(p)ppGpp synthase/HD superfamily hydrolase
VGKVAQTNLQLLNQLRIAGWSPADLGGICEAYTLAMRLFSARFRPSGKPFVAHLVGTASILARFGASVTVVTAGLLHAAYDQGDFGNGRNGITEAKRRQVHKAVGAEVEALIAGYTILQWNRSTFSAILGELQHRRPGAGRGSIDPSMENILLIRLANDLEDLVDLAPLYCGDAERRVEESVSTVKYRMAIATRLGFPGLAAELEEAVNESRATDVIPTLRRDPPNRSFLLAPASHELRLGLRLQQFLMTLTW